jgi:hypothetical protein
MKAIILHTAAIDNSGARRDAGETLTVGDGAAEITLEFAKALIDASSAVEAPGPRSRAKVQPDATSDEAE